MSQIEFNKSYYYKDNIYANIDIDYLKHLIHEFLFGSSNVGNDFQPYLPQLYNSMVEKLIVSIEGLDDSIKSFIKFVKTNFYDKDLKTANSIASSYNKDARWIFVVNQNINKIKNSSLD